MITDQLACVRRPAPAHGLHREGGFTLIELMIVVVIMGVIITVVVPGFASVTLSTKLTNYANELVASVYMARGEAIKRNRPVRLCTSADGATCATTGGWQQGWIVLDPNDVVLKQQQPLSAGFVFQDGGSARTLTFDATGLVSPPANFTVCRQTPSAGSQERQVSVSTIGRTNVSTTRTASCP